MIRKGWLVAPLGIVVLLALTVASFAGAARLQYVVDGDTVRLRSDKYVRLIGVDAPETDECGGTKNTRALKRLTQGTIWLKRPPGYANKDRYGRLLRYVHDSGRDTGKASIWHGWAQNYDAFSHPRQARYKAAERSARKANSRAVEDVLVTRGGPEGIGLD